MSETEAYNPAAASSPVVIGGIGGSGTRVLHEIITGLGWNLGSCDLNIEKDYTGFTVLFKDARWKQPAHAARNARAFNLLERALRGRPRLTLGNIILAAGASLRMAVTGHNAEGTGRGLWAIARGLKLFFGKSGIRSTEVPWGWKEPNSHIWLTELAEQFPGMRYVHLLRHGADMAFSENQQQLAKWGALYGVRPPTDAADLPRASLDFWVAANRKAHAAGQAMGPDRFYCLTLEDLCRQPEQEIAALAAFLGAVPDDSLLKKLAAIPSMPASVGRHRHSDLAGLDPESLSAVEEFGYEIDSI